ncbi:MAG TPA: histone deacetylase [Bacillota bacterium]|nr:histone deacetylase [Bacillota bacterium]HOP69871.1 histone deacetylase [Bacillota bacterium]HPT33296.1 histone deacetylase [Bacillota bacterium]HPZ65228.1 histone deacetylase [Bacillota bacterium]HQD05995.1 histone deacetylase [Bacillota bacterium]
MKPTGILFFPAFDWAISPTHPEREERLLYTRDQIFEEGVMDLPQIREYQPRLATPRDIARVHFCVPSIEAVTTEAHLVSAGGALVIGDAVASGEVKNGFAIIRPPGHHAMSVVHGNRGFCNINNEAIMIEYLRRRYGYRRIAIVDTDVHHGDGTQEIYYHDPDVLFISFHQDGRTLYPGSGFVEELGAPPAVGTTINIPLAPYTTDQGILLVLEELILPLLEEFKPELVVNSAGQDNHYTDPLASMRFTATGYAQLNRKLAPHIAVLEGGYSVETALPYVNLALILAMAGIEHDNLREPDYDPAAFKEDPGNLARLKRMAALQRENFRRREEEREAVRKSGQDFYTATRRIYYDTDNIHEFQQVRQRLCPRCCSYRVIASAAAHAYGRQTRVLCFSIPLACCSACRDEAREAYIRSREEGGAGFDYLYLQDRPADEYRRFHCQREQEVTIV